jgi:hypothetical protein
MASSSADLFGHPSHALPLMMPLAVVLERLGVGQARLGELADGLRDPCIIGFGAGSRPCHAMNSALVFGVPGVGEGRSRPTMARPRLWNSTSKRSSSSSLPFVRDLPDDPDRLLAGPHRQCRDDSAGDSDLAALEAS